MGLISTETSIPTDGKVKLETKFNSTGDIDATNKFTIFDFEKDLITSINEFYVIYAEYVRCSGSTVQDDYNTPNYNTSIPNGIGTRICTGNVINKNDVDTKFNIVKNKAEIFTKASNSLGTTGGTSNTEFKTKYNDILDKYSNNLKLRGELDLKLKEIFKTDDSKFNESKLQYDSAMYTGIVWTILATSCLYYVFTSL